MDLQELKKLLGIQDNDNDETLEYLLEGVIEYVKTWTNNPFKDGIPFMVKLGIAELVGKMYGSGGDGGVTIPSDDEHRIKSEKIDGIQVTYFSPAELGQAAAEESSGTSSINERYFKPYRKVKFI